MKIFIQLDIIKDNKQIKDSFVEFITDSSLCLSIRKMKLMRIITTKAV